VPVFEYRGLDSNGKAVAGIIDADTAKLARMRLRKQGLFPTDLSQQAGKATRGKGLNVEIDFKRYFQFVTSRDIALMTTQLATLVGAHIPMSEALGALVDQTEKPKLKVTLSKIRERVNEGSTLADSLADHPKIFDELFINMVRAGERSGALSQVLVRLAKFSDSQVKLQSQIASAMAYPILMGIVGLLILLGIFLFVIPRIRSLFDSIGGDVLLPLITRVVFFFGDLLVAYYWLIPVLFVLTFVVWRTWVRSERGSRRWDILKLNFPIFGKLNRQVSVARFCRTLSTLLLSGVPILTALIIAQKIANNVILEEAIDGATKNISEGQSIAAPLKASGQFPPLVTHMIAIGERTGELERMLTTVADAYEDQVEATVSTLTSLLAPVMILVMGGIIFLVALGLLLPMANISQMMSL
jgi:general secretion pathway protein F